MSNASPTILRILLSYDELIAVLKRLNAGLLPGLQAPPPQAPTPEQRAYALELAERALRARELARLRPDGQLQLHAALVSAVAVCANAERALVMHHYGGDGSVVELYGAQLETSAVAYWSPEPELYEIAVLDGAAALVQLALAMSGSAAAQPGAGPALVVEDALLAAAREVAEQGGVAEAAAMLGAEHEPAARAIAATLSEPHAVTVVHVMAQQPDGSVARMERTLLHGGHGAWLITPRRDGPAARQIRPGSGADLRALLTDCLAPAERSTTIRE